MPRRRGAPVATSGVPIELTDAGHDTWADASRCARWFAVHRLTATRDVDYGPRSRLKAAAEAWAIPAGIVNSHGRPDWVGLRAAGVDSPRGYIRERITTLTPGITGNRLAEAPLFTRGEKGGRPVGPPLEGHAGVSPTPTQTRTEDA